MRSKELEQIIQITKKFIYAMLPGQVEGAFAVFSALVLMGLLAVCFKSERMLQCLAKVKRYGIGVFISITGYICSLYATYLFSMSYEEAITLNSLYRYYGTGAVFTIGITIYIVLKISEEMEYSRVYVLGMLLLFVILTPGAFSKKYIFSADEYHLKEDFRSDIWRTMEIYIPENSSYTDSSYAVLWNEEDFFGGSRDNGRVEWIAGSWLRSKNVLAISAGDLLNGIDKEKLEALRTYDYLACISDMSSYSDVFSQIWDDIELMPGLHRIMHDQ